ncbi:MAG: M55 family metallopeptidase [Candidatus Bathyarchaeota archaeon]|nr:M55 family metallopeptidase [Candidatus Bathyarchaeota archaeon]
MKVYVVCDLEGVAGIVDFKKQCMEEGAYYQQAIRVATQELNALIDGLIDGGATEVYAWPGHGDFPGGIDFELIHPECKLVMHAGDGGPAGIDSSFDAMVLHGFHGMAGASNGVLSHSFYPLPRNIWFDDKKVGEIALNIYSFGEHGVPCIMVTGDQAAADEAKAIVPDIEQVPIKWGLAEKEKLGALTVRQAISLSPEKAREKIREAATKAMQKLSLITPVVQKTPFKLKVEFIEEKYADSKSGFPGVKRLDSVTISKECHSLADVVF